DVNGSKLDLMTNNAIVDYTGSPGSLVNDTRLDMLHDALLTTAGAPHHRLGYGDNEDPTLQKPEFSGVVFPAGDFTQLLVKYTYGGDANLDGQVNIIDLYALASHWQDPSAVWTEGDFDYNGMVDAGDLGILASNWQAGTGAPI